MKEMYSTLPDGLSGNEDCGQMSSWYVLSAMGLYQIAPGNPYYEFGRPLGVEVILPLEGKKELKDIPGLKRFFRLRPPEKGFERKGIKKTYAVGGVLGYRKDKINELIMRML